MPPYPLDSPATELSAFDSLSSPTSDYANSLFSPPLTKSSQLSLNTTVLGASTVSHSKPTASSSPATHIGSGGRRRGPAPMGSSHVWKHVDVFSPMLEEDEDGVFSSPSAGSSQPSSRGRAQPRPQQKRDQERSETPPLRFTPRRPSGDSIVPPPRSSSTNLTPTNVGSQSTSSRTQAMISQFEQRQQPTPRSSSQVRPQQQRTPSRTQLDKPLPPLWPQDAPGPSHPRPVVQHSPSSFLPAPPAPSPFAFGSSQSPTRRGDDTGGPKRSPLRDGIKSLVKKFSSSTSPSKFRRGHKASASSGSEMSISRPTHIGGVSWDLRPLPGVSGVAEAGEEVLGSDVADQSALWEYPRTSRMDGEYSECEGEPYALSDVGGPAPGLAPPSDESDQAATPVSPQTARPLPSAPGAAAPPIEAASASQPLVPVRQSMTSSFDQSSTSAHSQAPILRHGPLLLFSSTSSPPHWLRTTATLSPSLISFAFASLRGSIEHLDYNLPGDSIVRSVPEREASGRWPAPFGHDQEDDEIEVHYLEIALTGQGNVAVAVRNVGERLGWVGSIWDAILAGVMSPDPSGAQILAAFPTAPNSSARPAIAAPLPVAVEDVHKGLHRMQDSPQDSLLTTPPLTPAHPEQAASYDTADIISCAVTTDEEGNRSTDGAQIRRSEDSDRSSGPPQLTLLPSKPLALSLLRRGSGVEDGQSDGDHSLRFSVEQMFRTSEMASTYVPPSSPSPPTPIRTIFGLSSQARKQTNVAALASAYESNSVGSRDRGPGSKASSGVGREERGEGPSSLDHFEDHTRAARIRSQAHHRYSKSNPIPTSPPQVTTNAATTGQPFYFSTRPGTSPSGVAMGRSRSDSLPQTAMFSPGGRSEYYVQDFDESDLNPSRSASQIQRRNPPLPAVAAVKTGAALQAAVQEQYEDVPTPRQSLLLEGADLVEATTPADVGSGSRPGSVEPSSDLTAAIQYLSAQAASNSTRSDLADQKLSTVQDGVVALVTSALSGDGKLDSVLLSLRGVEEGMKEVALGVVSTMDERSTLQATIDAVNAKLSHVLVLCEHFAIPPQGGEAAFSAEDQGSTTPRTNQPPLVADAVLPGGAEGRLPDTAFDSPALPAKPRSATGLESDEGMPLTNAATEDAAHGATVDGTPVSSNGAAGDGRLDELLQLIKSQLASRGPQDQQTTDIARYLNELNTWMEEFVRNGHSSVDALSDRVAHLQDLIQPPPAATPRLGEDPRGGAPQAGIVGQIAALRDLVIEVRDRQAQAGPQESNQQRLEQLLGSVEVERQHHQQQNSSVESIVALLERQRMENQELLKAMVHDLKGEIQGERIRFVDAMRDATQINVEQHLEKFKQQLSAEVSRSLHDLHRMREEKKVLEGQIAELFAFKVKNGDVLRVPSTPQATTPRRPSYPVANASPFPSPSVPLPPLPQQPF